MLEGAFGTELEVGVVLVGAVRVGERATTTEDACCGLEGVGTALMGAARVGVGGTPTISGSVIVMLEVYTRVIEVL